MGRLLLTLALFGCVCGCSPSTAPEKKESSEQKTAMGTGSSNDQATSAGDGQLTKGSFDLAKTAANEDKIALVERLMLQLTQLTEQANAAQATFDFANAAKLWRGSEKILNTLQTPNSWQTTNARLSAENAELQAKFSETQLLGLQELFDWQRKIAELLTKSDFANALVQAERSAQRTRELFGDDSYMVAKQWVQMARLKHLNGDLQGATEAYREAILGHHKFVNDMHPDIEALHGYIGECFMNLGQMRPAMDNLKKAARLAAELWGDKSLNYAKRANDLGVALQRSGEHETALTVLRAAESIRRQELGIEHPLVAHSLMNLGTVYLELNRSELAVQCFAQAIPILQQKMGDTNRIVVEGQLRYSAALVLSGRNDEAEKTLQSLIENLQLKQPTSPELSTAQYRLAVILCKQGRYEPAEQLLKAALNNQVKLFGVANASTSKTKSALAQLFERTGRTKEAAELQSEIKQVNYTESNEQFRR